MFAFLYIAYSLKILKMDNTLDDDTKKLLDENLMLNIKIKQLQKKLKQMKTKKPKENI